MKNDKESEEMSSGYLIKYALSEGITYEFYKVKNDSVRIYNSDGKLKYYVYFKLNKDFFSDKEVAETEVDKMIESKLKSLEKQREKLQKLLVKKKYKGKTQ